jgi:uncharacterized protein YcsI (UPF0317 family)
MKITVIVDASGSMSSMAKINTASALVKYCMDFPMLYKDSFPETAFIFYHLGNYDKPVLFEKNNSIKASGKAELFSLEELFLRTGKEEQNFLFLSDGLFERDDVSKITQITKNYPDMRFVPVAVGPDANVKNLKDISSFSRVFYPVDIMQAIETFYSCGDKCPPSIGSINIAAQSNGESWDA